MEGGTWGGRRRGRVPRSITFGPIPEGPQGEVQNQPPIFMKPQRAVEIVISSTSGDQVFAVHKTLLCDNSPFFNAAFNSSFLEGVTQKMNLPEVEPGTMGLLVTWLYTKEIYIADSKKPNATGNKTDNPLFALGKLWILARRALIAPLQEAAIKQLEKLAPASPELFLISFARWVYEDPSTSDSGLRRQASSMMRTYISATLFRSHCTHMPRALLEDMIFHDKQKSWEKPAPPAYQSFSF